MCAHSPPSHRGCSTLPLTTAKLTTAARCLQFGEILLVWGLWVGALPVIAASANPAAGWATLLSPAFTMLILLLVSGLPFAEGQNLA